MEEISRPMKTRSSSTAEVMSSMPTVPRRMSAKNSPMSWVFGWHGVDGSQQGDEHGAADEQVEEDAEGIGLHDAEVGGAGRKMKLPGAGGKGSQHGEHAEPADGFAAGGARQQRIDQHDERRRRA